MAHDILETVTNPAPAPVAEARGEPAGGVEEEAGADRQAGGGGDADGLDAAGEGVGVEEVRRPDPAASAVYAELRPMFESAGETLAPVFARLRGLDPGGPSAIRALTTPAPPPSPAATSGSPASAPGRRRGGRGRSR